ncbi:RSP_2648 family PIN domain-containing protein [Gemmobacter denitrificans]|uniref:PIN domain-containing protein n=1 Tax=Gemmobacter denitrificans TaxID=3123040 RepID=A0ABU8BQJ7_9RHOB
MRVVLDACVLFPSVLRDILLKIAARGLYEPVWSDRILGEWTRAVVRLGPQAVIEAEGDALRMRAAFPQALHRARPEIASRLVLPDPDDLHVLAVAVGSGADAILTFNASDFPGHVLAAEGIARRDPDGFLWELWSHHPDLVAAAVAEVQAEAERRAGQPVSLKAMLKRIRLGRLARALTPAG